MAFTQTPLCRDLTIFHWTYKRPSCVPPLNRSILAENTTQNEDYDSCGEYKWHHWWSTKVPLITLITPTVKSCYLRFLFFSQAQIIYLECNFSVTLYLHISNCWHVIELFQELHCSIKTLRNCAQHSNTFMYLLHVQKVMYSVTQNEIIKNNSFLIMIDYQYSNCKIVGTYLWIAYLACCCDYSPILTETAVCRNCLLPWVYEWT